MPDLQNTLQSSDLGFLRIIAGLWGIELSEPDFHKALPLILDALQDAEILQELIDTLSAPAQDALAELMENEGRLPWSTFTRKYGQVRSLGPGRRDRERPDLNPASPAEVLWYRALIGRAFLNLPPEPQEFAFIPDEFLAVLNLPSGGRVQLLGRPASPGETVHPRPVSSRILDDACTLLAGLRCGYTPEEMGDQGWSLPVPDLIQLLTAANLLDANLLPRPETVREFLGAPRAAGLSQIAQAWLSSRHFNELHLLPGLVCEGGWSNDPLLARNQMMEWISTLPEGAWWSLPAFISAIHERHPDFQRPGGDYDSWFIRRQDSEVYLRGFSSWEEVDGVLLRYTISGPLHWLGFLDLAAPSTNEPATAFRTSAWFADLWLGKAPAVDETEDSHAHVNMDGSFFIHRRAPRALRYQAARFAQWLPANEGGYNYRITPASLEAARGRGLRSTQLIQVLKRLCEDPLPPLLMRAIERWEETGAEARIEPVTLLRVNSPEILAELRKSRAARYLGESLSPTLVLIRPGSVDQVSRVLAEIGYLADVNIEPKSAGGN